MYRCYECKTEVGKRHFTARDGRILCKKCSEGVEACTDRQKFFCEELTEGYYYFYMFELFIKLGIDKGIIEDGNIEIKFKDNSGGLTIWKDTKIRRVPRPSNILNKFEWCYMIKDSDGRVLGYIGRPIQN